MPARDGRCHDCGAEITIASVYLPTEDYYHLCPTCATACGGRAEWGVELAPAAMQPTLANGPRPLMALRGLRFLGGAR